MSEGPAASVMSKRDRPYVLHLSGDFPDPFQGFKSQVIKSLIDLTRDDFDHRVISLNRINPKPHDLMSLWPSRAIGIEQRPFAYGLAITYEAPPLGFFHHAMLSKLAEWLVAQISSEGRRPDLIVGHKLTIEGIVARLAAQRLQVPYAITIQGNTDTRIVSARQDLAGEFRRILSDAAMIFPFAPWALDRILTLLRLAPPPHSLLPCPTDLDDILQPKRGDAGLVSVFHLKNYKIKNLANMVKAMQLVERGEVPVPDLTVIGGGEPHEIAACRTLVGRSRVRLAGAMHREQVRQSLNSATALVMPSLRESFGLVFVEALFAGTPIIYPAGAAVDGYFDDYGFAIRVDARDPKSIADGIARACRHEMALKDELMAWQSSDHARKFRRAAIGSTFRAGLQRALTTTTPRLPS